MFNAATLALLAAQAADGSNPAGAIWLTGAFAAAGGITAVINLAALFATRREVEAIERRRAEDREESMDNRKTDNQKLDDLRDDVNQQIYQARRDMADLERRLNEASEKRAKETHERINDVLTAVSTLGGKFEASRQQLPH